MTTQKSWSRLRTVSNLISLMSTPFSNISEVHFKVLLRFVEHYKVAKNEKNRALVVKDAEDVV